MGVLGFGSNHFYGFAQAGAWNSVTSVGTYNYMPGHPSGLKLNKPLVFSKQARSMGERAGRYGQYAVEGAIVGDWHYEGWGKLLANAFKISSSAGTGFSTHTLTVDDTGAFSNPYGLVIHDHIDLKTKRNLSCFVKELVWTFPSEPFTSFQASIIGASRSRENAVSPSFGSLLPSAQFGDNSTTGLTTSVTINGHTFTSFFFKQLTIKISVPVDLVKVANLQAPAFSTRPQSKYQVEVSWTGLWNTVNVDGSNHIMSTDWLDAWDAETTGDVTFALLGGAISGSSPSTNYSITWNFPDLYVKGDDPVVSGPGEIEQTFTASGAIEAVSGTTPATITLVNNETIAT